MHLPICRPSPPLCLLSAQRRVATGTFFANEMIAIPDFAISLTLFRNAHATRRWNGEPAVVYVKQLFPRWGEKRTTLFCNEITPPALGYCHRRDKSLIFDQKRQSPCGYTLRITTSCIIFLSDFFSKRLKKKRKERVFALVRFVCVPLSLWARQPDAESVGLAARQWPPWNSLLPGSNGCMCCVLDGLSLTQRTRRVVLVAVPGGNWRTGGFAPSVHPFCGETILLDAAHWTMEHRFCMAAYLTHDNAARCPGLILSERPTDFIQLLNSPVQTGCNCRMRLTVLQAALKGNVISSPIYMKTRPATPLKNVYEGRGKTPVIDSDGGPWLAAHLMRKLQPSGKHKTDPVELIKGD